MTTMIATVSVDKRNIDVRLYLQELAKIIQYCQCFLCQYLRLFQESISTCRFAQRVAMIKNEALLNEELDPALVSLHV